jgi:hypothetical protein
LSRAAAVDLVDLADTLAEDSAQSPARRTTPSVESGGGGARSATRSAPLQIGRILLENALVHTPAGTSVRRSIGATAKRCWRSGRGPVFRRARGQVFDRFYRLEGSGAGGAVSGWRSRREFGELMNGSIRLDLPPGADEIYARSSRPHVFGKKGLKSPRYSEPGCGARR